MRKMRRGRNKQVRERVQHEKERLRQEEEEDEEEEEVIQEGGSSR